ncbi:MAG: hypothetical protein M9945_08745 [Aquamicrobium sp.]|nr:hypothetical protein [Aquamicrobium sp.]
MAEGGDHLAILPRAVRKYEVEQAAFFAGGLAFEQRLSIPGKFENPDALVHVELLGLLVAVDVALQAALFLSPFASHLVEEIAADLAVELVDIHGADPLAEPPVLGLEPLDRFLVLVALVRMSGVQRLAHPVQNLVVEPELAEHGGELLLKNLLAHILAATGCGLAPAFVGVAGAVIVDVFLLLDLADHRAAAARAGDQAREGEVVGHAPMLAGVPAIHHALHPLPCLDRDQRLVLALIELAVPLEPAGVKAIAQDRMHGAGGNRRAALLVDETSSAGLLGHLFQRKLAGRVPLEQLRDDRRDLWIDGDDLAPVRAGDVQVAERRLRWPNALLGLLLLALAGLLGQVVDVVLRHQHLDAVHELFRRPRLARQHNAFLRKVDLGVQLVDRHPVLEVAIEPVGLLDKDHPHIGMRPQPSHHLAESAAAGLLGGLDVHILLRHGEALSGGVVLEQLQLRRDRVALLLLLLGGDTRVDHSARAGRRGGWLGDACPGWHNV